MVMGPSNWGLQDRRTPGRPDQSMQGLLVHRKPSHLDRCTLALQGASIVGLRDRSILRLRDQHNMGRRAPNMPDRRDHHKRDRLDPRNKVRPGVNPHRNCMHP
jgi:hypothetical protein